MADDTKVKVPATVRFFSKYAALSIAVKSAYYKTDTDGHKTLVGGNRVVFVDGFFETNDEALIETLRQRQDFGTAFVEIPKNKTVDDLREAAKANDVKERELAEREAELDAREKRIKAMEEGGSADDADTSGNEDGDEKVAVSDKMGRPELEAIALEEGSTQEEIDSATNKGLLVELIEAKRVTAKEAGASGSFEE